MQLSQMIILKTRLISVFYPTEFTLKRFSMLPSIRNKLKAIMSLNDPKWGNDSRNGDKKNENKGADSPPDLDQIWRDAVQRWNALLSGKNGSAPQGGGSDSGMRGAGLVAALIAGVWLVSGVFIVQEGQTAVITTFGKFTGTASPGMNWRIPYPVQQHEIVNLSKVRTIEVGYRSSSKSKQPREALMLTDDENIVDVQFAVQYKLKSASEFLFNNRDQDEDLIRQVAETAVREVVGKNKMDFVLYEGRDKVSLDVAALMQQILERYQAGILVTNVTMQGVQPPEQVQAAFDDAVKAGQDKERQKNEGQAYANEVIPKAKGEASRIIQEAEGYRAKVVANAEGNASRFKQVLAEYQKAPAVTRDRMYLETMQQIFASTSKVMMDSKSGNNMVYIPLDKMMNGQEAVNSGKSAAAAVPGASHDLVQGVEIKAPKDARARDVREREGR